MDEDDKNYNENIENQNDINKDSQSQRENLPDEANQTADNIKTGANLAKNAASGNYAGAAKDAIKMLGNKKNRKNILEKIKKENKTVILYEAPHKLVKTLEDIMKNIGDINCVLAKELTKIYEEFVRNKISYILENLKTKNEIKGEYIILLDLNSNEIQAENDTLNKSIEEQYEIYLSQGMSKKEIIKQIAKNEKVEKNKIYQIFIGK